MTLFINKFQTPHTFSLLHLNIPLGTLFPNVLGPMFTHQCDRPGFTLTRQQKMSQLSEFDMI